MSRSRRRARPNPSTSTWIALGAGVAVGAVITKLVTSRGPGNAGCACGGVDLGPYRGNPARNPYTWWQEPMRGMNF